MQKLNSTGSFRIDDEGNYYSYHQQMTAIYRGYKLFDNGYWSVTTRKHQCNIRYYFEPDIYLEFADFNKGIKASLQYEIEGYKNRIANLKDKRNTQKKLRTIKEYEEHINKIEALLNE